MNPRSNGLAENAVKTCKKLREKARRSGITFDKALYAWAATPRADGASPAFLLMGYHPRLLGLPRLALPPPHPTLQAREQRNISSYDKHGGKLLSYLECGDTVRLQDKSGKWKNTAVVKSVLPSGNSYLLTLPDGQEVIRGRRLLKPFSNAILT